MSRDPPTPPSNLPTDIVDRFNRYSAAQLRQVARYAEALAEHRERTTRLEEESDGDVSTEPPDDRPDDVPAKATITVKGINDNRYYYWQWREGDTVTSKYKGPVEADE